MINDLKLVHVQASVHYVQTFFSLSLPIDSRIVNYLQDPLRLGAQIKFFLSCKKSIRIYIKQTAKKQTQISAANRIAAKDFIMHNCAISLMMKNNHNGMMHHESQSPRNIILGDFCEWNIDTILIMTALNCACFLSHSESTQKNWFSICNGHESSICVCLFFNSRHRC